MMHNEAERKKSALAFLKDGASLKDLVNYHDDRGVVFEAVKQNGANLKFASESLKSDKDIVLQALKSYPNAMKWADRLADYYAKHNG